MALSIMFMPAGLRFTLYTNSKWLSEYFQREYQHLLMEGEGDIGMVLTETREEKGAATYECVFPDGSIANTTDLSTVMVWLNRTIKKAFRPSNWWPFHSGALIDPYGNCVLLCGHSGSGKTTFCVYLIQHGWRCLTDDLVWFQTNGKSILPMPVSFNVRDDVVKGSIVAPALFPFWFPDVDGNPRWIYPNQSGLHYKESLCPKAVFLLKYSQGQEVLCQEMPTNEALKMVLTNAYSASDMRLNIMMSTKLVKHIPIYQIRYPDCAVGQRELERSLHRR